MNNFYPKGALKGREEFETKVIKQLNKPGAIYLVSFYKVSTRAANVYRINLGPDTIIELEPRPEASWRISHIKPVVSALSFKVNEETDYIESAVTKGYVFNNFWHAYGYVKHLEQSNIKVDWSFPVGVG